MGYSERKRHAMVAMMNQATLVNRARVWFAAHQLVSVPKKVRGWAGLRWVLTGKTEGRS